MFWNTSVQSKAGRRYSQIKVNGLFWLDLDRSKPFWSSFGVVRDLLSFRQSLEAAALDCRMMNKDVFPTIFRFDKSKAFRVVEPFYCTSSHSKSPRLFQSTRPGRRDSKSQS